MSRRDDLEQRARALAAHVVEAEVLSSENLDFRGGTFLLAAIAAELGQFAQRRCMDLAREGDGRWELAVAEAESLINGAWRTMEMVSRLSGDFRDPSELSNG
jgi:hypothetical protein